MRDVKVEVPGQIHMTQVDEAVWEATGAFVQRMLRVMQNDDRAFSIMLSRVGREIRRTHDLETVKAIFEGLVATMEEASRNDR